MGANEAISPADAMTKQAMELVARRKQEIAQRAVQEEAHLTEMRQLENQLLLKSEEQKVHALTMQMKKEEMKLQKDTYGSEGAAQVEASKCAKAVYLFSGNSGQHAWT